MKIAYVIFQDSPAWYVWPFKKNFRHVSVVVKEEYAKHFVHINFRAVKTEVTIPSHEEMDRVWQRSRRLLSGDPSIKVIRVELEEEQGFNLPLPFNCVETVKRIIGVRKWWVVTPHQLYRYLIKHY